MKNCLDLYEIKFVGMLAATAKDMVCFFFFFFCALLPLSQTDCATYFKYTFRRTFTLVGDFVSGL
jgi:hypothetical protein